MTSLHSSSPGEDRTGRAPVRPLPCVPGVILYASQAAHSLGPAVAPLPLSTAHDMICICLCQWKRVCQGDRGGLGSTSNCKGIQTDPTRWGPKGLARMRCRGGASALFRLISPIGRSKLWWARFYEAHSGGRARSSAATVLGGIRAAAGGMRPFKHPSDSLSIGRSRSPASSPARGAHGIG